MAEVTLVAAWLAKGKLGARLPLGVLYLAGELLRQGHKVEIRDCQLGQHDTSVIDLIMYMLQDSADIIGISCMSDLLPAVLLAVTRYKEQSPNSIVVLGGPGPTSVASEILRHFPAVDYIVKGEGEDTLAELINRIGNGVSIEDVSGLCYRHDGIVYCGRPRVRIKNLDDLHPLPYSLVPINAYSGTMPISTARGCTYGCSFCDVSAMWQRKVTWRSIDNVIAEMSSFVDRGITRVNIVDDTFILSRRRTLDFCHRLIKTQLPISWHCNGRINLVDESLLATMAEAGCASIFFGVESGSDDVLRRIRKGFNRAKVLSSIELAAKYIPLVTVSFIWGFPFESLSDFQATRDLYLRLMEIENVKIQVYELTPFANAPIYQEFSSELYFDGSYVSVLNGERPVEQEEKALIKKHPQVFPNFYRFRTPHREKKIATILADWELLDR